MLRLKMGFWKWEWRPPSGDEGQKTWDCHNFMYFSEQAFFLLFFLICYHPFLWQGYDGLGIVNTKALWEVDLEWLDHFFCTNPRHLLPYFGCHEDFLFFLTFLCTWFKLRCFLPHIFVFLSQQYFWEIFPFVSFFLHILLMFWFLHLCALLFVEIDFKYTSENHFFLFCSVVFIQLFLFVLLQKNK